MRHFQHPTNNGVLGAPQGVSIEACNALPVTHHGSTLPMVTSFWRPEPEELAALNAGGFVMVTLWGQTHAPLKVEVGT